MTKIQAAALARMVEIGRPCTPYEIGTRLRTCRALVRAGYARATITRPDTSTLEGCTTLGELFEANARAKALTC